MESLAAAGRTGTRAHLEVQESVFLVRRGVIHGGFLTKVVERKVQPLPHKV